MEALWEGIRKKRKAGDDKSNLDQEFQQIREVTNQYNVPDDVCESYEAVYNILECLDRARAG